MKPYAFFTDWFELATPPGIFYILRLESCIHFSSLIILSVKLFLRNCFCYFLTVLWNKNHFSTDLFGTLILFTNPSARAGYDTRSIFKRSLTGLNSEFSFSKTSYLTKTEEPNLSYYLPIAGGRIIGFIPFPRVLVRCEMQSVSSRIWTRFAVSISYDDNDYTTGISIDRP